MHNRFRASFCTAVLCLAALATRLAGSADLDLGVPGCEYACPVVPPQPETCNGADDNCDGHVDEGIDKQNDVANCGGCGSTCEYVSSVRVMLA